ncbi:MAG: type II secretion system protein [Planctomycetota bacterium]|nr:MAG: type II secretion system protein [Planctomycetota bacterium]
MTSKRAFTLVELLVVIAIIALLMAILMPVLSKAKEQARDIVCRSNLRQYGIAATMYLEDNEHAFPPTHTYLFTSDWSTCQWHDKARWATVNGPMWPYLKDKNIHLCPSFRSIAKNRGQKHPWHDPQIPVEPQYGYSMNAHLGPFQAAWEAATGHFKKVTQIRHPANVFFFSEENIWPIWGMSVTVLNDTNLWIGPPYDDSGYDFFATFHNPTRGNLDKGTCNTVFIDGHAEKLVLMDGTLPEAKEKAWEVAWPAYPASPIDYPPLEE